MKQTPAGLLIPETPRLASASAYRTVAQKLGGTRATYDVPMTDDELWVWVRDHLNVEIPRVRVCPDHVAPFEAFAHAFFARDSMSVWLASRGFGGKSFLLALLTITESILLGASTNLLGGSGEQSERVHRYLTGEDANAHGKFWDAPRAPRGLLKTDPTKREMRLTNGGQVKALMASSRSVRGPHPQRLRLDEVDEMALEIFDAAQGQTMAARGIAPQTVCSSTHHNPDGTFTEVLKRASENHWPVFEWCYRENLVSNGGWLEDSEVDRKRAEIPRSMWQIEYELQEPSPKTRAIDPDCVRAMFDKKLGHFRGDAGKEIRLVEPFHLRSFYHGTDWARDEDWTIIHTMQETPADQPDQLAAWIRLGRQPWPLMIEEHNKRVEEYGGPSEHDATGVGEVCDDFLRVDSVGFDFRDRRGRAEMLSNYIAAVESGKFVYPMIEYAYHEHLYATTDDIYGGGGSTSHLPDTISAAALAYRARELGLGYDPRAWNTVKK